MFQILTCSDNSLDVLNQSYMPWQKSQLSNFLRKMKSSPVFQQILSPYLSIISWSQEVILSLSNICFHLIRQFISTTAVVRNKKLSSRLQPFLIKMNTFTRNQSTGTHEMHVHRQGDMYSVTRGMIE